MVHLWAGTSIFACALYLQQALARPSTSDESASERVGSVTGTLDICNYNYEAFEKPVLITAFEDARAIASAAVQYKWGNDWQGVMDYYFGTSGCNNAGKQEEITGELDFVDLQGCFFLRRCFPLPFAWKQNARIHSDRGCQRHLQMPRK